LFTNEKQFNCKPAYEKVVELKTSSKAHYHRLAAAPSEFTSVQRPKWRTYYGTLIEYVLKHYEKRRDWGEEFRKKLRKMADDFAVGSTYFTVKEKNSENILATIRFIHAPYGRRVLTKKNDPSKIIEDSVGTFGPIARIFSPEDFVNPKIQESENQFADNEGYLHSKNKGQNKQDILGNTQLQINLIDLPMEKGLKIKLPRNAELIEDKNWSEENSQLYWSAGEIIEPGNFAIDKEHSSETRLLLSQFVNHYLNEPLFPNSYLKNNRMLFTYNDIPKLYTRMGFKILPGIFESAGTQWQILQARPEEISKLFGETGGKFNEIDQAAESISWQQIQASMSSQQTQ
jgi:hypothetical protein